MESNVKKALKANFVTLLLLSPIYTLNSILIDGCCVIVRLLGLVGIIAMGLILGVFVLRLQE